jgi:hypothetical protein
MESPVKKTPQTQQHTVMVDPERFAALVALAAREQQTRSNMARILIEESLRDYTAGTALPRDMRNVVTKRVGGRGRPIVVEGRRVRMFVVLGLELIERLRTMGMAEDRSIASMMRVLITSGLEARERAARKTA